MEKELQNKNLREEILKKVDNINSMEELNELKIFYFGKKGSINKLSLLMNELDSEEKKTFGMALNTFKNEITNIIEDLTNKFNLEKLNEKLENENIDVTLPGTNISCGVVNPLQRVITEIEEIFISMGYDVKTGPEIELDLYNFEMLNLPKDHPARDAQDTFYITEDKLLRTQTSPVQIRTMLENKEKGPIRIICPGKVYRRDEDDASHSHQFTQLEGLFVDEKVSLAELKGTLDVFAKRIFGNNKETRFRPSYYPFTEPSVEFDVLCHKCNGEGCNICKGTGWITIMGAGMVHPNVLKDAGYDPNKYTGFAFGMGIERITMLKYGINDVRTLYTNDIRFLNQFNRIGGDDNES